MLGFFAQLTFGSLALSLTSDEPPHVAHGYIMLATGDTWALSEHRHPPLLNMLAALPLLLQPEHPDPATVPGWHQDFVVFVRNLWPLLGPVDRQAFVTRVPTMLLSVALMALVARWAREAFGRTGALAAVAVMVFDPAIVAHGQLATTDLGVALFTFAAVYLVTQGRRSTARILGAGAALGAALASKGSGVLLVPVIFALLAWRRAPKTDEPLERREGTAGLGARLRSGPARELRRALGDVRLPAGALTVGKPATAAGGTRENGGPHPQREAADGLPPG